MDYSKIRSLRQKEFSDKWLETKSGILHLAPRFGKISTSINCFKNFTDPKILVIYPINTIKDSWKNEFIKWSYDDKYVEYSSTRSLWKYVKTKKTFDIVVVDEIHMLSEKQLSDLKELIDLGNKNILALSGTLSYQTKSLLLRTLNLPVLCEYSIEKAIEEKVISDYYITVLFTELDNKVKHIKPFKKSRYVVTEKERYDYLTSEIVSRQIELEDLGLLPIQRMHVLKQSIAKLTLTRRLIEKFKEDRILVFCGLTATADNLKIPVYHSKNKNEKIKNDFCNGIGKHLATVDMFEAGVTVKPINKAIINSFDSDSENLSQRISRLTGFEYDNPDKVAQIYIICTNTIEKSWLQKALEPFSPKKIRYVTITK